MHVAFFARRQPFPRHLEGARIAAKDCLKLARARAAHAILMAFVGVLVPTERARRRTRRFKSRALAGVFQPRRQGGQVGES